MYFWLNIDLPTSDAKLHVKSCRHVAAIDPTPLKGVGKLKRDGGWMVFETEQEAEDFVHNEIRPNVAFNRCQDCSGR